MGEPSKLAYNVPEAARATGISRSTLFAKIKDGELPSFLACGRRLIWAADLEAWLGSFRRAA